MTTCYHREAIILGMMITFFIFAGVFLWWDGVEKWWRKTKNLFLPGFLKNPMENIKDRDNGYTQTDIQ